MTKIFPVQTAQPDSLLARRGPAAALAPAPHLPAEPARPRCPLRPGPSRAGRARRPLPPLRGPAGAVPTPVPVVTCCPGAPRGSRPAAHGGARGTGVCGNSDPARLSASRGQTPTNPPRGTGSAGRALGLPGGHPSRAANPSALPQDGSREERAERGVRGARSERYRSGSRTKKTMCGGGRGQRRHLRVRGGAGRCGRGASSLPPRLQRRLVPSFGRLFGLSSAVCRGVWGTECFCFG